MAKEKDDKPREQPRQPQPGKEPQKPIRPQEGDEGEGQPPGVPVGPGRGNNP